MNAINHEIRLAARPGGLPARSDWELTTEPVPAPGPGEFVVAVSYLSIDPAMRRWIDADYREPVAIGTVMETGAAGRVIASEHPGFAVGEHVYGGFGVQEYTRSDGTGVTKLAGWLREGRLVSREDILAGGVRAFPDALPKLFAGQNTGKLIVVVQ